MFKDQLSVEICRMGGPIGLFICTPIIAGSFAWTVWQAHKLGQVVPTKTILQMVTFVGISIFISIGACRIGLGWFGGKK